MKAHTKDILQRKANDLSIMLELLDEFGFSNMIFQIVLFAKLKDIDYKLPKELRQKVGRARKLIQEAVLTENDIMRIELAVRKTNDCDAQEDLVKEALQLINKR